MKFFADTADLGEIKYSFGRGVNDGITTNPKIMESTGKTYLMATFLLHPLEPSG